MDSIKIPTDVGLMGCVALLAATVWLAAFPSVAETGGDPARGAKLFLQCRACHAVAQGEPSGVGPNLSGLWGAKAGRRPGYHYSAPLAQSGIVWTTESLDSWLTRPTSLVPGTTMAFQGVNLPKSRADLIAYLQTLGPKAQGPEN